MNNEKKQVGIITLHGYHNYGNRLQNYALIKIIESLGSTAYTLVLEDKSSLLTKGTRKMKTFISMTPYKAINIIKEKRNRKRFYLNNKDAIDGRTKKFKEFSANYLKEKYFYKGSYKLVNFTDNCDYFVTGSDQVWNPLYINNMPTYFLDFVEKEKRVAYAASFGCSRIPKEYEKKYYRWLSGMNSISVRETTGAKIIKDLTGLEVPVLVDPTLLLSKDEWLAISKKAPNRPDSEYILTYFLGEIENEIELFIKDVARRKRMKIVRLGDIREKETYINGPQEFIDYINSSSILFTDSFHGVAFSILFGKPFVVYERKTRSESMYSRIDTILDKFNLRNRESKNIKGDIFDIDYTYVIPVLEKEKAIALEYLKNALK